MGDAWSWRKDWLIQSLVLVLSVSGQVLNIRSCSFFNSFCHIWSYSFSDKYVKEWTNVNSVFSFSSSSLWPSSQYSKLFFFSILFATSEAIVSQINMWRNGQTLIQSLVLVLSVSGQVLNIRSYSFFNSFCHIWSYSFSDKYVKEWTNVNSVSSFSSSSLWPSSQYSKLFFFSILFATFEAIVSQTNMSRDDQRLIQSLV